ncbi:Hypothetical predicted protein [Pelobates cultripes]|uniref:Uncharacterized protein n=1 Tax=Pelobates cultripes TaxID=61616 RepID=A0AAD1RGX4_PELCU|nr:Hypothetical predicted protein [Pelobates cultripes]
MTAFPNKIAEEFRQYYQLLYNLHERDRQDEMDTEYTRGRGTGHHDYRGRPSGDPEID